MTTNTTNALVATVCAILLTATGCAGNDGGSAGGGSGGAVDSGTLSDAVASDTGSSSGALDTGSSSGATDTGSSSGATDAASSSGATDTASSDTGAVDAASSSGAADTASSDSGATDTASSDSGAADTAQGCKATEFEDPTDSTCKEATCPTMSKSLTAAIAALVDASNTCTADTDCDVVQTGTGCRGTCGAAINKQAKTGFGGKLATIDDKVCKKTGYPGKCGYSTPSCIQPTPGCVAGKCVYTKPAGGCTGPQPTNTVCEKGEWVCKAGTMHLPGGGGCVEPTCKAVQDALHSELKEALAAGSACKADIDCTTVGVGHACWGACPAAISVAHKAGIEAIIGAHDDVCKAADYAKTCGYMTPKCLAPNPGCDAGVCVYAKK